MPRPRRPSSTKIMPTQPTGPLTVATPVPDDPLVDLGHQRDEP